MRNEKKKQRLAFRPSVADASLEQRIELAVAGAISSHISAHVVHPAQANQASDSLAQIRSAFQSQRIAAFENLRGYLNFKIQQLFANGTPTAEQLNNFNALASGAVNNLALRLSSQASLLPISNGLVSSLQFGLLGPNGLGSQIQTAINNPAQNFSASALTNAIGRQINLSSWGNATRFIANPSDLSIGGQLNQFLGANNAPLLNFFSTDQNGNQIPLQQFIGQQLVNQVGNTLGSLNQSIPTFANSTLFANGVTNPTVADQTTFLNQTNHALGTAALQLGSGLALFPNIASSVTPGLQSSIFGNGANSIITGLSGLTGTSANFNTGVNTTLNTGFQSIANAILPAFGLPLNPGISLTNPPFTPVFGQPFLKTFGGFNNGFGTGFTGFGVPTAGFNTNFGTGFNSSVNGANILNFGFTAPTTFTLPGM